MSNEINRESEITVFDNFADGNIEVLFQDEVALDVDVSLFYIKSGQEEIQYYVDHVSKPEINKLTASQIEKIKNVVAEQTADAKEQLGGYAENTIQPSIDTYVETEVVPELDNYKNTAASFATMAQTSAEAAQVSAAEASEAVGGFDAHVQQKQTDFDNNAALKQSAVDASAATASENAAAAANSAEAAAESALNASVGNIGDIKYTARIDLPNGGVWADGAEYTQSEFPDVYQMLVSQRLQSVSMADFNNKVAANGVCGYFGVDTANASFKVPLLQNVYLKAGTGAPEFAAESLPNITGSFTYASDPTNNRVGLKSAAGAFYGTDSGNNFQTSHNNTSMKYASTNNFDASRCSAAYQAGAKVNPDHVVYRAYVVLYSSVAEVSITDYTQQLEVATNTGIEALSNASNALRTTQISNCIMEIPQDIMLNMEGNTLTLKAGSKVYIPNGVGVFNEITIENDISKSYALSGNGRKTLLIYKDGALNFLATSSALDYYFSGETAPSQFIGGYAYWYDTSNNLLKFTSDSGVTWESGCSLPIGELQIGTKFSINQTFNGFGYIGKTVFALPGIKGLIPDGRNTDGTLNNQEFVLDEVITGTLNSLVPSGETVFVIRKQNNIPMISFFKGLFNARNVNDFTSDTPWYNLYYLRDENKIRAGNQVEIEAYVSGMLSCGGAYQITSLRPRTTFNGIDYSDGSWVSAQSMPNGKYIDLTLGASGTAYTAPANGYFMVILSGTNATVYVGDGMGYEWAAVARAVDDYVQLTVPCMKGHTRLVDYKQGSLFQFRFIYAEGEV